MKTVKILLLISALLIGFISCNLFNSTLKIIIDKSDVTKEISYYYTKLNDLSDTEEKHNNDELAADGSILLNRVQKNVVEVFVQALDSEDIVIAEGLSEKVYLEPFKVNIATVKLKEIQTPPPTTPAPIDNTNICSYHWSPDGRKIAFIKYSDNTPYNNNLYVAEVDSENITEAGYVFKTATIIKSGDVKSIYDWQGDWILYTRDREEGLPPNYSDYRGGEAWRIKADGTEENQVTFTYSNGIRTVFTNEAYTNIGTVLWARIVPDTEMVYFTAHNGNGWTKTYICNADGTDNCESVSSPTYTWKGAVSPTGDRLYYAASDDHNTPMTIFSVDTGLSEYTLVKGPMENSQFYILEGGEQIAFCFDNKISVMDIYGAGEQVLLDDLFGNSIAGRGRNGNEILIYTTRIDGFQQVCLLDIYGETLIPLSSGNVHNTSAALSPDNTRLCYLQYAEGSSRSGALIIIDINEPTPPPPAPVTTPTPRPQPDTLNYAENFDSIAIGEIPEDWLKNDSPQDYNFIRVSGPTGPFTTNAFSIIDNQAGMRVISQNSLPAPLAEGRLEFDFYCADPGTMDYHGEFFLSLYDASENNILNVLFYAYTPLGWLTGIIDSTTSGFFPFNANRSHHLVLYLYDGNAFLYINDRIYSSFAYTPAAVVTMQFLSTNASIGQLYIDNLRIME